MTVSTNGGVESESDVIKGLREELDSCQEHLAQKKELLSEALAQLKVFLKDEEMLENEIGENEQLLEEIEDLKYDLSQSERARKWLAQRLNATVESFQKLSVRYLSQKVFGYLVVNALHEKTRRQSLQKCVQRWQTGKVAGAFDKWQAARARKHQLIITCGKIITRWLDMGRSVSFCKWAGDTAHTKVVQQSMRKMVLLWRNRSIGAAYQRWIEHIDERRRMKYTTFKIMARWKNKTICTVFWAWAGESSNSICQNFDTCACWSSFQQFTPTPEVLGLYSLRGGKGFHAPLSSECQSDFGALKPDEFESRNR